MGDRRHPVIGATDLGLLDEAVPHAYADISPCGPCEVRLLTVCAALSPEELRHLAAMVTTVALDPGQPLFDEGEPADHIYIVTAGVARIYKLLADGRRQVTGFLFERDYLGFAHGELYAYGAEAVTPCTLCRFQARKFEALMKNFPRMESQLLGMAHHELAAAQDQMLLLGRKTAKERIASFLLMLMERAARLGRQENPVPVPMTRSDIADYLGLTTETVSRAFTQLKGTGVISLQPGGKVRVVDRGALNELAGEL